MDRLYQSPMIELDFEKNMDQAVDVFDEMFRKYFSHFLNINYEFIPQ